MDPPQIPLSPREPRELPYNPAHAINRGFQEIAWVMPNDLYIAIEASKARRMEKLQSLDPKDVLRLGKIEELLAHGDWLYMQYLILVGKYYKQSKRGGFRGFGSERLPPEVNKEFEKDHEISLINLEKLKNILKSEYDIENSPFSIVSQWTKDLNEKYVSFCFFKEQLMNRLFNEKIYEQELNNFFSTHKEFIYINIRSLCSSLDFTTCTIKKIEFISKTSETHNKGKKPVFLHLIDGQEKEVILVCKPRNAGIDSCVINLFHKINENKTDDVSLPCYDIFTAEDFSIWEKIEGDNLRDLGCPVQVSPYEFIEQHTEEIIPSQVREKLLKKIKKMTHIFSILEISDLHIENLILQGAKKLPNGDMEIDLSKLDIVPIDLEVIYRNYVTFLIKNPGGNRKNIQIIRENELEYPLSGAEKDLIKNYKENLILHQVFRALPVATDEFAQGSLSYYSRAPEVANLIMKNLKENYSLSIQEDQLIPFILNDILYSDIPFFTEKNGMLYYGAVTSSGDNVIGKIKIQDR